MHLTLLAPPILTNRRTQKSVEYCQVLKLSVSLVLHEIYQCLLNYNDVDIVSTSTRDT